MSPIKRKSSVVKANAPDLLTQASSSSSRPTKKLKTSEQDITNQGTLHGHTRASLADGYEAGKKRKSNGTNSADKSTAPNGAHDSTAHSKVPSKSIPTLPAEEPAFPRGGASILTPLEHKQIAFEAQRDVLFENTGDKGSRVPVEGIDDDGNELAGSYPVPTKKRRSNLNVPQRKVKSESAPKGVRMEGLSYKRILPGSLILGQITRITRRDVALALPNNLTGYVPLTAISDQLTEKIQQLAAQTNDEERSDDSESENVDLKSMFIVGQYLRASVVSAGNETSATGKKRGKKRIELSVNPAQANEGLSRTDLVINSLVQASVVSVEDHGLIMDLGLSGAPVKGFISSNEVGSGVDYAKIKPGAVLLCLITGQSSNGKIIKLSADMRKAGQLKTRFLAEAPSVDAFLPGTGVQVLVEEVTPKGIAGKVMGALDVTSDLFHVGATAQNKDIEKAIKVGQKIKGRVIFALRTGEQKRIGISLLDHICSLSCLQVFQEGTHKDPVHVLPLSTILEEARVFKVFGSTGIFLDVGVERVPGFVHVSQIADERIDDLSESTGPYRVDKKLRARIISYNPMDGLYIVSTQESVLSQPFLSIKDVKVGEVVKGKVEELVINEAGVGGVLVNIADGITGLVPEMHMADVKLSHPERKFKEGMSVKGRVLSTNPEKRRLRITLKKSLVNTDLPLFLSYDNIEPGARSVGALVNVLPTGAVVQFYGPVRGFLPVSEMSEAYIQDATEHFRVGQVVNVRVMSVDAETQRMLVSCKDLSVLEPERAAALKDLKLGGLVSGKVIGQSNDDVTVELQGSGLKAILQLPHLTEGSEKKSLRMLKEIRVDQTLTDLVVWDKNEKRGFVVLTNKPSLVNAAKDGKMLTNFEDFKEGLQVNGIVKNIHPSGVFVQFAGGLTGLILKKNLPEESVSLPDYGMRLLQSITVTVREVLHEERRFLLTMRDGLKNEAGIKEEAKSRAEEGSLNVINPVDENIKSVEDCTIGKVTKARITGVKSTQINVQLADNIQGRIDVSEVFDSWDKITDRKRPLHKFKPNDILDVRILGQHDARNHRFLPITHRRGRNTVFELSAKPSVLNDTDIPVVSLSKLTVGSTWLAFINSIGDDHVWVNVSPNVRGRIRLLDLSDDASSLNDLEKHFPIGSAVRARVLKVDIENNRLDLSARSKGNSTAITYDTLTIGSVIPARITKVNERSLTVQLSETAIGMAGLTDIADDFTKVNLAAFNKNDVVRVCITEVDAPIKHVHLSMRPSKVFSSSLPVKDPEVSSIAQLKVGDVVRGFIKNVADNGVFVSLGSRVTAYVRVADLSDGFIKDWKSEYEVDQLIEGKVMSVDPLLNHVGLSLKRSVMDENYKPPITFNDVKVGQVITGKIRKVEDFGIFIVIDNSANVSGLCHRSQIADERVQDVKRLYEAGDAVKAKILKVEPEKRRISFGLKASYFADENDNSDESMADAVDDIGGVELTATGEEQSEDDEMSDGGIPINRDHTAQETTGDDELGPNQANAPSEPTSFQKGMALATAGFDWTAGILDTSMDARASDSDEDMGDALPKKKRRRKAEIKIDRTGDLDAHEPQSVADFERLLLGQPDSSLLWLQYMAFQLQLSEVTKAREIAERALRTIHITEDAEKLNVWVAMLNLENTYGTDESIEDVFKRACQYNDTQEIHEKLTSIYIQSGKYEHADTLFQNSLKKFSQSPSLWLNYATFLMTTVSSPDSARALLPRATQSLPPHTHLDLTSKFGQLEFRSPNGDPERGRTIFEGLLNTWPKRLDLWNVLLDLEIKRGDQERVRSLFERILAKHLKPRKAKWFFKRWLKFEEEVGGAAAAKMVEKVKAKAEQYVRDWKKAGGDGDGDAEEG